MKKSILIAAGLSAALGMVAVYAQPGSAARSNKVVLENCLISAHEQVQLPGSDAGVLASFDPKTSREGTEVEEGTVLGHLDFKDLTAKKESAEAEIKVAKAKAESDAELQVAIKTKEVAEAEVKSAEDANKKQRGTVPENELRRLKLTVERAFHEGELRKMERSIHEMEVDVKKAQLDMVDVELDRRQIKAPINGVVVERLKNRGEWVQPGETIFKLVRLDRLRVEGFVPADKYSPREIDGANVVVSVETPGGQIETATGTIEFVSPVVEASGEYRVWTEIENRKIDKHWVFSPGTVAKMEVSLRGGKMPVRPISTKVK